MADEAPITISSTRANAELFLVSGLILLLELACIRWLPAHVLFLTFFTNVVLLASFLGMSVGCLAAAHPRRYLNGTPVLLGIVVIAARAVERLRGLFVQVVDVGHQDRPQVVFFGTEHHSSDPTRFFIPIEVVAGFFFVMLALAFVGLGQELGRALNRVPNRIRAYTLNIAGSIVGIVLFAGLSWLELPPGVWLLPVVLGLAYLLYPRAEARPALAAWALRVTVLLAVLLAASFHWWTDPTRQSVGTQYFWSPYYRIDYEPPPSRYIGVNLIGHQQMHSRDESDPGHTHPYALPYLLNKGSGNPPFQEVLIIGAGSGNDLSRALQWGAKHVDAVEIDPVIQSLGRHDHPDQPYQQTDRVSVHLGDGRNFLKSTDRRYDLIVYALLDSLVLHSSYSNIRLESYLFTEQAFADIKKRLKPGGLFITYNYFRQGWIVARLQEGLEKVFGAKPLVLTLPYKARVEPEEGFGGFTMLMVSVPTADGRLESLRTAFQKWPQYWLSGSTPPGPDSPNGFTTPGLAERKRWLNLPEAEQQKPPMWQRYGPAEVISPQEPLRLATDDWPFLYLRRPLIPDLSWRGALLMAVLAVAMLWWFAPRQREPRAGPFFEGRMFFLGAGFMLIETKAVVHMALLFGSTWMVNSVVFFAVLVMILAANLFVLTVRPRKLGIYYAGLFLALVANAVVPLDSFLGLNRTMQVACSCLLVFAPILFAAVIFAVSFNRTTAADRAFGFNIAGAMVGGLAEYSSMLLGFQYLELVAVAFYLLSAIWMSGYGTEDKTKVQLQF